MVKVTGTVIAHHGASVTVEFEGMTTRVKPPDKQKWVVGDMVRVENGIPKENLQRRNELARVGATGKRQVLAVNLDLLLIVTACQPGFNPVVLDSFVIAAHHAGIRPVIVLNKIDLDHDDKYRSAALDYRNLGLPLFCVCAITGEGMDDFYDALADNVSALVGQSGVGKTSLLNHMFKGIQRKVGVLSEKSGLGKHTTTSSLMVTTATGARILDSPGIRQFTPTGLTPSDVAECFPGFMEFLEAGCHYRDCLHMTEPGCSILAAVEDGRIEARLFESYKTHLGLAKKENKPNWKKK